MPNTPAAQTLLNRQAAAVAPRDAIPALLVAAPIAARALGISARSLWAITAPRGDIPCVKVGSRILYDPQDLAEWRDAHKVRPAGAGESQSTETGPTTPRGAAAA